MVCVTVVGCSASGVDPGTSDRATGVTLGPTPLGVNVAAWDGSYLGPTGATIDGLLRSADLKLLRYPGGSWADEYHWATDTDTSRCAAPASIACIASDPLAFDSFSAHARSVGASSFVTVNYGSGTPAEAAAWVAHAGRTKGSSVALWEVGNEGYSCSETNQFLQLGPSFVQGYAPDGPVCPDTSAMAASYAVHVVPFLTAIHGVDAQAGTAVPWAFDTSEARGSGVTDAASWDRVVLRAVRGRISSVDAHWYPFDDTTGVTDDQVLSSLRGIPSAAARIRSTLHRYSPDTSFVIGETNISDRPTTFDLQPVAALFAAGTSIEWLVHGAASVVWWDLNNFGSPTSGDYGIVTSGGPEPGPVGSPLPPYYGELLASRLTAAGSHLDSAVTGISSLLGFQSTLGARRSVLLINTDSATAEDIAPRWFAATSRVRVETYSASSADATDPVVRSTLASGGRVTLPPLSIVVLTGAPRS